ncbi:hypothetical protein CPB86DRAFT_873951 [Serendipita vermifera]|nr:hypothetical protein CPB86DRAFT_873951 [Serendipita vermifera]
MSDKDQLIAKRLNILRDMENLSQKGNIKGGQHLVQELRQDYNNIMDTLERLDWKERYDPVDKLPPELFGIVIDDIVRSESFDGSYEELDDKLILTLVSKKWREFILGMPLLWTKVQVHSQMPDFLEKTILSFNLSQDLPISLELTLPIGQSDTILPLLLRNRQRIQRIILSPSPHLSNIASSLIFLEEIFPLPNLIELVYRGIERQDMITHWVLKYCDSLQSIKGLALPKDTWQLESVRQLRNADVIADMDTFMASEHNMPSLQRVRFGIPHPQYRIQYPTTYNRASLSDSENPQWQDLTCYHPSSQSIPFLTGRLTNLSSLSITSRIPLLLQLLVHLHQISRLRRLTVLLDDNFQTQPTRDDSFTKAIILPNPQVKFLEARTTVAGKEGSARHSSQVIRCIPDALIRAMPEIEELVVNVTFYLDVPEFYEWSKLTRLSILRLTIFRRSSLDRQYILPLSLREVHIDSNLYILNRFSSPNATKLFARGGRALPEISSTPLDAEKWPHLRSLLISWRWIADESHKYIHLNELKLSVGEFSREVTWFNADNATRFCHALANNPAQLPLLESLCLYGLPQWDILLIMLRRRNINRLQGIRPLRALQIRAAYPIELTGPITSLLNGRFPELTSFYEFSLHGSFEIAVNPSIPGCQACQRCFKVCTVQNGEAKLLDRDSVELPPYPDNEEEILSTWETRNRVWMEEILPYIQRVHSCYRLEGDGVITLRRDSI